MDWNVTILTNHGDRRDVRVYDFHSMEDAKAAALAQSGGGRVLFASSFERANHQDEYPDYMEEQRPGNMWRYSRNNPAENARIHSVRKKQEASNRYDDNGIPFLNLFDDDW